MIYFGFSLSSFVAKASRQAVRLLVRKEDTKGWEQSRVKLLFFCFSCGRSIVPLPHHIFLIRAWLGFCCSLVI